MSAVPGRLGGIRRHLVAQDPGAVLGEFAAALLAEEGQAVPDWEIVGPQIAAEIDRQSGQLLADARDDYDGFEAMRARAAREYGRVDPLVCVLCGGVAAFLALSLASRLHGLGLTQVIVPVLLAALGLRWVIWRRRRAALMRSVPVAGQRWREVLRDQVLRPFTVEKLNDEQRNPRLFSTWVGGKVAPRLIEGTEPRRLVVTEAMRRISATALNIHSGSLGVSGPRGVGKSTILQFFGTDAGLEDDRDLRLVVPAPVDYQPREFIIHLFGQLCEAVPHGPGDRSAIAAATRRHLDELRYLRTYTTSWSASLTPRWLLGLVGGHARQRAEQPLTLPELVASFRAYSGQVAAWQRSVHGGAARVVIAIDEVDRILDSDRAEAFLNDIKAVFGVPGCLYLVSLSEDAIASFAHRTPSIRTTFDSTFDELVPVGPMTYRNSEQLLFKRVTGVPRPFLALCHVLAGGLPRDLIRAARALIDVTPATGGKSLPEAAGDLVRRDLESLRQASVRQLADNSGPGPLLAALHDRTWPGSTPRQLTEAALGLMAAVRDTDSDASRQACQELVVALSFYATVHEIFSPGPAQDHLVTCLKERRYGIVDDLAAARYAMRVNARLAHQLLEQFRMQNGLGPPHATT